MLKGLIGYLYAENTVVMDKSDIRNASDEDFRPVRLFIDEKHNEECLNGCIKCVVTMNTSEPLPRRETLDYLEGKTMPKNEDIILAGHGSELCYNKLNEKVPELFLALVHVRYQRASYAALIAENGDKISADRLLPSYLRLPQAERELKAKQKSRA